MCVGPNPFPAKSLLPFQTAHISLSPLFYEERYISIQASLGYWLSAFLWGSRHINNFVHLSPLLISLFSVHFLRPIDLGGELSLHPHSILTTLCQGWCCEFTFTWSSPLPPLHLSSLQNPKGRLPAQDLQCLLEIPLESRWQVRKALGLKQLKEQEGKIISFNKFPENAVVLTDETSRATGSWQQQPEAQGRSERRQSVVCAM